MHITTVLSYKDGWNQLNGSSSIDEILKCISLFYEKKAFNREQGYSQPLLKDAFSTDSWFFLENLKRLGVLKDGISIRTIDGTSEFLYQWLFADCKKAHINGDLSLPVLFVKNKSELLKQNRNPKKPDWTYFEKVYDQIVNLTPLNLDYPFVILCVNESEFNFGTPHVIELPYQKETTTVNIRDMVTLLEKDISIPDHLFEPYLLLINSFAKFVTHRHSGKETVFSYKLIGNRLELALSSEFNSSEEVTKTIKAFNEICNSQSASFDFKDMTIHRLYDQLELVKAQLRISERYEEKYVTVRSSHL